MAEIKTEDKIYILEEAEPVIKTVERVEKSGTVKNDTREALRILLGEES